jgi:hypothetical protein
LRNDFQGKSEDKNWAPMDSDRKVD